MTAACHLFTEVLWRKYIDKQKLFLLNIQEQLTKNSDMFWKPTLALQADPASVIVALAEGLGKGYSCPADWPEKLKLSKSKYLHELLFTNLCWSTNPWNLDICIRHESTC